jgi:hypothetical protein
MIKSGIGLLNWVSENVFIEVIQGYRILKKNRTVDRQLVLNTLKRKENRLLKKKSRETGEQESKNQKSISF